MARRRDRILKPYERKVVASVMSKKNIFIGLCILCLFTGCGNSGSDSKTTQDQWIPKFVTVKYRADSVDVAAPYFEPLQRFDSSVVREAWFDARNQYMVIDLQGTTYHYCGLNAAVWELLKAAESIHNYYLDNIRGNFDCRIYPVPSYP